MNCLLPVDALNRELVFDFFWKFSVFECALKRGGFLKKGRKAAEADWICFGKEMEARFVTLASSGFQDAAKKLRNLKLRRPMNRNQELKWEPVEQDTNESEAAYTLRLLTTVRNNLFHGGKYPDGDIPEVARDREVMEAARIVLEGCHELHPVLNADECGRYPATD